MQDTLIIFNYFLYEDAVSEENKSQLKKFIERVGRSKINQIQIKGYSDAAENRHAKGKDKDRSKKAYKLLSKLGIPSSKLIIINETENNPVDLKRIVEIRIK